MANSALRTSLRAPSRQSLWAAARAAGPIWYTWAGTPSPSAAQVPPALPPTPICIGPAAPAELAPERTPGRRFCQAWNQRCQPFVWFKDAELILARFTRHQAPPGR